MTTVEIRLGDAARVRFSCSGSRRRWVSKHGYLDLKTAAKCRVRLCVDALLSPGCTGSLGASFMLDLHIQLNTGYGISIPLNLLQQRRLQGPVSCEVRADLLQGFRAAKGRAILYLDVPTAEVT